MNYYFNIFRTVSPEEEKESEILIEEVNFYVEKVKHKGIRCPENEEGVPAKELLELLNALEANMKKMESIEFRIKCRNLIEGIKELFLKIYNSLVVHIKILK